MIGRLKSRMEAKVHVFGQMISSDIDILDLAPCLGKNRSKDMLTTKKRIILKERFLGPYRRD